MQNEDFVPVGVRVRSVRKLSENQDVYCLSTNNGNFVANGLIVKNCDAVRYALATHKPASFNQQEHYKKQQEELRQKYHPGGSQWI